MAADEESRRRAGQAIYQERARRGWSVETAMDRGGVGHMTWRRIERGDAVQAKSYRAVDQAFDWPIGHTHAHIEAGTDVDPGSDPETDLVEDSTPVDSEENNSPLQSLRGRIRIERTEKSQLLTEMEQNLEQLSYFELQNLQRTVNHLVSNHKKKLSEIHELLRTPEYRPNRQPLDPEDFKKLPSDVANQYTADMFEYGNLCATMSNLNSQVLDLFASSRQITTTELDTIHQQAEQTRSRLNNVAERLDSSEKRQQVAKHEARQATEED